MSDKKHYTHSEFNSEEIPVYPKTFSVIAIALFLALLIIPSVIWFSLDAFGGNYLESIAVDLNEKRELSKLPTKFNAKTVTLEVENYYNDHVPFRSNIINLKREITSGMERIYSNSVEPFLVKLLFPFQNETSGGKAIAVSQKPVVLEKGDKACSHVMSNKTVIAQSDCFKRGAYTSHCTLCGYKIKGYIPEAHKNEVVEKVKASYETYGYTVYKCSLCGKVTRGEFIEKLIDLNFKPMRTFEDDVISGKRDWLFFTGANSVGCYQNTNPLTEKTMEEWLSVMQELKTICDKKGIKLQFVLCPNKEQVYSEYMPTLKVVPGDKRAVVFSNYVKENSDVGYIYLLDEMLNSKMYYDTYYKYDTHWNHVGAFIGVQAIYRELGMETTDISSVDIIGQPHASGDLLNLGNLSSSVYKSDVLYKVHYREDVNYTTENIGPEAISTVSPNGNGESIVLIGDSFRNSMVQFMAKDFSKGVFSHRSAIENEEVINAIKNTDVLVVEAVERFDSSNIDAAKKLIEILSEN